jgi:pimeloyl-ACP methyl ester carboxylesterase
LPSVGTGKGEKVRVIKTSDGALHSRLKYPIEDHWITLDGARMRFLRSGTGPALVLVHGLLGYSFSWRYTIPVLAPQSTVHAVDMLGVGFSDRPQGLECNLRACAERLLRFLDAVGIESCDLLGTSHGGGVVMRAAALAPERVHRLILVAPVNPWSAHGKSMAAFLSHRFVAPVFLRVAPVLKILHGFLLRRLYGDRRRIRPGTLQGYSAPFAIPGAFEHGIGILRTWNQDLSELEFVLPRIAEIPTLLVWGAVDNAVDPRSGDRLRQEFRDCQVAMLEGVGHLPYEEAPEEFSRAVRAFLAPSQTLRSGQDPNVVLSVEAP